MKKVLLLILFGLILLGFSTAGYAEDTDKDMADRVERDYLDLIDQHVGELVKEYGVTSETEGLIVRRAVKNYIIADLVDYTLLIFMAKYNVATGGIDMKKANAEIIRSLRDLSESANSQMLDNINALRAIKGMPMFVKGKDVVIK